MIVLLLRDPRVLRITDRLETVFKILFFLYAAATFNCLTFGTAVVSVILWPTFVLGAVLIVNRIGQVRRYRTPYRWWLVALLGAGCLSVLLNHRYNLKLNIVYMACWAFYFLLLYVQPKDRTADALTGEIRLFATLYTVFAEIAVIVSIVMLFSGYSLRVDFEGGRLLGGFVDSRLYGLFIDPNAGATCAAVAGLFLIHAMSLYRRWWQRVLLGLGAALNLFYIALSDSRTGMVVLLVIGFVYTFLLLSRRLKTRRLAPLLAAAGALVVGLGCLCAPYLVKSGYNGCVTLWAFETADSNDDGNLDHSEQELLDSLIVERDYDLSGDISNRRFSVWKSGLEIFAKRPLFGTSYGGFTAFAKEHLPDTYIVNNDHIDMVTFDNEIVNVLVSNGLLGAVPMLVFAVGILLFILRRFKGMDVSCRPLLCAALAAVFGIAASAMFRSAIFYYNSCNANLFWTLLGILATMCAANKNAEKQGEADE